MNKGLESAGLKPTICLYSLWLVELDATCALAKPLEVGIFNVKSPGNDILVVEDVVSLSLNNSSEYVVVKAPLLWFLMNYQHGPIDLPIGQERRRVARFRKKPSNLFLCEGSRSHEL